MNYIVSALPVPLIEYMWPKVAPFIQLAIEKAPDEETLANIKESALSGQTLITVITKGGEIIAVLTMEVREFSTGFKALYLPIIGGAELMGWIDQYLKVADAIAKDFGCQEVRGMAARAGWLKVIKSHGFEEGYTIVKRKVDR